MPAAGPPPRCGAAGQGGVAASRPVGWELLGTTAGGDADVVLEAEAGWSLTRGGFGEVVARAGALLDRAGVAPGGSVALALPSRPDLVALVVAALAAGVQAVLLDTQWLPRELRAAAEQAAPDLVVAEAPAARLLADLAPTVVLAAPSGVEDLFAVEGEAAARLVPGRPDRAGVACGTTGTWGEPQLLVYDEDQVARWLSAEAPPEAVLLARSVAHVAGLRTALAGLAAGGSGRLLERWSPRSALRHLGGRHTDRLCASGPQLNELGQALARRGAAGAHLSLLDVGGGRLFRRAAAVLGDALGAAVVNRYVASEAGGWATATEARPAAEHQPLDLGTSVPGVEVEIGEPLDDGPHGLVRVRGAATARARLGPVEPSRGAWAAPTGGWDTGDLGRLDPWGRLELLGRARDRFRPTSGHVDPVLVELALAEHPAVADVAVTLRPDATHGAVPVALTVPVDPEAPPFLHELAAQLAHLPPHARPRAQAVVERLPLTGSGQVNRRMLAHDEVER